jgi:hypothetical protein
LFTYFLLFKKLAKLSHSYSFFFRRIAPLHHPTNILSTSLALFPQTSTIHPGSPAAEEELSSPGTRHDLLRAEKGSPDEIRIPAKILSQPLTGSSRTQEQQVPHPGLANMGNRSSDKPRRCLKRRPILFASRRSSSTFGLMAAWRMLAGRIGGNEI